MRGNQMEYLCRLRDISLGGCALTTPAPVRPGEHIICYLDEIGRIEGPVYRVIENGFVLTIKASERRRERLAATLMWLANREILGSDIDQRRPGHHRTVVPQKPAEIILADGTRTPCTIIDISISGASISIDARPPIGSEVWLGRIRGRILRHHEAGIALNFVETLSETTINQHFGVQPGAVA